MSDATVWSPPGLPATDVPTRQSEVDLIAETKAGLWVALAGAVLGVLVGVLWAHTAPSLDAVAAAVDGSAGAFHPLLTADLVLGLIGLGAGVVLSVGTLLAEWRLGREPGPGTVAGLAVGGLAGSIVAAVVGTAVRHDQVAASVSHALAGYDATTIQQATDLTSFHLRAVGVTLAWSVAATAVYFAGAAWRWRHSID